MSKQQALKCVYMNIAKRHPFSCALGFNTNPPLNDGKSTTLVISITINCHWLIIASRRVNNIYLAAIAASTAACWASLAAFAAALAAAFSAFKSAALGSFFSTAGAEAAALDDEPLCDVIWKE